VIIAGVAYVGAGPDDLFDDRKGALPGSQLWCSKTIGMLRIKKQIRDLIEDQFTTSL
jgi:hypothetical protein